MTSPGEHDPWLGLRQRMVEEQIRRRGVHDERVLAAMARVPRHEFVAPQYADEAYGDHPLPIGERQTISQPYVVAAMTEAARVAPGERVLEVGTGSGYQTAVLAELAADVYSVERHASLATHAQAVLQRLGYSNVHSIIADGSRGYPDAAPYNAIVVTAAAPGVPPALFEQLKEDGRLVIPVGTAEGQALQVIRKISGRPVTQVLDGVRFVPLIGAQGFGE
jgi:protein-L-isoaspartate(D-aspartate) O-methyltransferase